MWQQRIAAVFLALTSNFLIQYNAVERIQLIYPYFQPRHTTFGDYVMAAFWIVLPPLFLPFRKSPASAAGWVYYVFLYLSSASVGVFIHETLPQYNHYMLFLLTGLMMMYVVANARMRIKISSVKVPFVDKLYIIAAFILVLFVWHLAGYKFELGIDNVYERRMEARDTVGAAGYLLAALRLLVPLLGVYIFVFKRNVLWPALVLLGCLGVFSYDGTKSSILYVVLIGIFAASLKRNRLAIWLLSLVVAINSIAIIEDFLTGRALILDYVVRRAFVVPGWLSSVYWTFDVDPASFRDITYDVGRMLFGNNVSNANTNFMMWGWAWAGWLGGLVVAVCAGAVIYVFNYVPESLFPDLGTLMAAGALLIWSEQFLHTSMLSSGVALLMLTALLFRVSPSGWNVFGVGNSSSNIVR
jgi:hypothetical protein